MKHGSRSRLMPQHAALFGGTTLFDAVARAVCAAGCLPRKELYEAWEVARRVRRRHRGGVVYDLACGHGLLGQLLLILDDTSPRAVCVDRTLPKSHVALHDVLVAAWPRLLGRVEFVAGDLVDTAVPAGAVVVSAHACGGLTDLVLDKAVNASAIVAVLPCCHDHRGNDDGGLGGWMDGSLAIDATRAARLRWRGYDVVTQAIPADITPKNRLLLGSPTLGAGRGP